MSRPELSFRTCPFCKGEGGGVIAVGHPAEPEPDWQECPKCDFTGWQVLLVADRWIGLTDALSECLTTIEGLRESRDKALGDWVDALDEAQFWRGKSDEKSKELLTYRIASSQQAIASESEQRPSAGPTPAERELKDVRSAIDAAADAGRGV